MDDLPILDELRAQLGAAALRSERRPARRRVLGPAVALAAAACAVAFVLAVGPQDGAPPADHTAVDPATRITHLVFDFGPVTGGRWTWRRRQETWLSHDRCRARLVERRPGGELRAEGTESPEENRYFMATRRRMEVVRRRPGELWEIRDLVADFRALRDRGRLRDAGRDRRGATTLRLLVDDRGAGTVTYFVDEARDLPVEIRTARGNGEEYFRTFIRTYERVPADPRLLRMSPHPGVPVRRRTRNIPGGLEIPREAQRPWCDAAR